MENELDIPLFPYRSYYRNQKCHEIVGPWIFLEPVRFFCCSLLKVLDEDSALEGNFLKFSKGNIHESGSQVVELRGYP